MALLPASTSPQPLRHLPTLSQSPATPWSRRCWSTWRQCGSTAGCGPPRRCRHTDLWYVVRTTTLRGGTTGWTVAVVGAIWTCTSWPRFCSRSLRTSAFRLHWCLSHICSGTSGRPISACKGGWRQCGQLTRLDSWQRRHCSASTRGYMQWQN